MAIFIWSPEGGRYWRKPHHKAPAGFLPRSCSGGNLDHQLAARAAGVDEVIGGVDLVEGVAAFVDLHHQLAGFDQLGGFPHDLAMMGATLAAQQWHQREDARVSRRAERQRRQCMRTPAEATDDVAVIAARS